MKEIEDELKNLVDKIQEGSPLPSELQPSAMLLSDPDHPIWELWQRMAEIYGHQWSSQQGDEPNETWCAGLSDLSPEQFMVGFKALFDRQERWPPNLVEFRQMCLNIDESGWERQCHKLYRSDRALEDKTAKEARAAENLDNIRKLREETGL